MHIIHVNLAKGFRGGERQTALLIQALSGSVKQQTLVCRSDSPLRHELRHLDCLTLVDANHLLQGHAQAGRASIVHAHEAKAVHWAWVHKKRYRTPYVVTRRVDTPIKRKWANRLFYGDADSCVAISSVIQQDLARWYPLSIPIIPSAASNSAANPELVREYRARYPGKVLIGHVGALVDRHKGQRELLKVAAKLKELAPEFLFVFFGDGVDGDVLKQESAGLDNIVWEGFKDNVNDYLPALDVFVFPSRNEGLGSVLLDVMQAGVPIIANNVGGIPDIIKQNDNGFLVDVTDTDSVIDLIFLLVRDDITRAKIVTNAYRDLQFYSKEHMATKYLKIYKELVS